jgi:hypothetical protein
MDISSQKLSLLNLALSIARRRLILSKLDVANPYTLLVIDRHWKVVFMTTLQIILHPRVRLKNRYTHILSI